MLVRIRKEKSIRENFGKFRGETISRARSTIKARNLSTFYFGNFVDQDALSNIFCYSTYRKVHVVFGYI